jgi:hypothetical protein
MRADSVGGTREFLHWLTSGLAGEALRLESYAAIGLIDPGDPAPAKVLDAARALQAVGFNSRALS